MVSYILLWRERAGCRRKLSSTMQLRSFRSWVTFTARGSFTETSSHPIFCLMKTSISNWYLFMSDSYVDWFWHSKDHKARQAVHSIRWLALQSERYNRNSERHHGWHRGLHSTRNNKLGVGYPSHRPVVLWGNSVHDAFWSEAILRQIILWDSLEYLVWQVHHPRRRRDSLAACCWLVALGAQSQPEP